MKYEFRKVVAVILVLVSMPMYVAAQQKDEENKKYNNYIELQCGSFWVQGAERTYPVISMIGAGYYRRVYKNIFAAVNYSEWHEGRNVFETSTEISFVRQNFASDAYKQNKIYTRTRYKMIDLSALYQVPLPFKHHNVYAGVGLTKYWGINYYVTKYSYLYNLHNAVRKREDYWGATLQAGYRYSFLRDRVSIGVLLKYRNFLRQLPSESNCLVTAGFNF